MMLHIIGLLAVIGIIFIIEKIDTANRKKNYRPEEDFWKRFN